MPEAKRKISVSLDEEVVRALELSDVPVSVQANTALRVEVDRRERQAALEQLCDRLAVAAGGWSQEDETEIERIMVLLGG